VSFEIGEKSIHGFVGPNGAGKTTTLKVLATLVKPQSGQVTIFDHDVARDFKAVRRRIGYMQDHFSMYRKMTVFEYLDFFGAAYGLTLARRNQTITDILSLTDMEGRRHHLISGLSRGMQQRVSLARALVHDPDLLLLDEPASGLDPRARIELMEILKELRQMGKTIFISSHILTELSTLCDHVTILDRGQVKYSGAMRGLRKAEDEAEEAFRIELAQPMPALAASFRELPGLLDLQADEDRLFRIKLSAHRENAERLLSTVFRHQGQLISFQEDLKELSEAFMDLTQPGVRS
jgi:ABC-2 type transport system ATP-binding protein